MRISNMYLVLVVSVVMLLPLAAQPDGVSKFDPFLQLELKKQNHIELLRQAEPGVQSAALSKIQAKIEPLYNVIFHGSDRALDGLGIRFNTRLNGIATARVTLHDILKAGHHPGISQIEKGGMMTVNLDRSIRSTNVNRVHDGEIMNTPFTGRDVIIGIIDTGIDFFHYDFRDTLNPDLSRIISIWDVRLDPAGGEGHPENFDYGVEYVRDDIQRELIGETQGAVRSRDDNGHGTHVAGIAGGNGAFSGGKFTGIAPGAEFVIVSFSDGRFFSAEVIDAMNYIFSIADRLGKSAVVNLSIGGHGGSHDGTAGHEQVITFFSQNPGQAVSVAAGNSGNNEIHYGQMISSGMESEFVLKIPNYNPDPIDNDDHVIKQLWYEGGYPIEVTVTSPNGYEATAQSGDSVLTSTPDGAIGMDTFDNYVNPKGARIFQINIHTGTALIPPEPGDWTIHVRNVTNNSNIQYNSWIVTSSMDFPWLEPNTGRDYTVTMPGTAEGAITAGAYTSRREWTNREGNPYHFPNAVVNQITSFSGGGPTRDGRTKPNITSPGQIIGSAESDDASFQSALLLPENGYVLLQGTSMASPHIAGIAALIFEANPDLTGKQIIEILEQSALSDNFTGTVPNETWGYGKVDAIAMFDYFEVTGGIPEQFYLYQNFPNPFNTITSIRFAIPEPTHGTLAVYDILGRRVEVIFEGTFEPRVHTYPFDASGLSSGVYFYRLETDAFTETQKMIYLR